MQIATYNKNNIFIINLIGEVDLYNTSKIKETVNAAVSSGYKKIIVNMNEVTYIDSTGIGTLISIRQILADISGELRLINIKDSVKKIFELTKLDYLFKIMNSEEEAIKNLL